MSFYKTTIYHRLFFILSFPVSSRWAYHHRTRAPILSCHFGNCDRREYSAPSAYYSQASNIGSSCVKKRPILSALPLHGHIFALSLLSALTVGAPQVHAASATRSSVFSGDELDLSAPCASVHLKVDPALKTGLSLDEATNRATVVHTTKDGAEQSVHVALPSCRQHLPLFLRLAPGTTLTLHDSPLATITIAGTLSTLESNLTDASLEIDHVQSLDLSLRGTSSVHIHQLDRAAEILIAEQARLHVDQAFLTALSAQMSGSSQLSITQGQIDTLSLMMADQSNASIMAQLGTANTSTRDNASLTLGHITDSLNQSGNGHIHQTTEAEQAAAAAPPPASPAAPTPNKPDGSAQGLGTAQPIPSPHVSTQEAPHLHPVPPSHPSPTVPTPPAATPSPVPPQKTPSSAPPVSQTDGAAQGLSNTPPLSNAPSSPTTQTAPSLSTEHKGSSATPHPHITP